MASQTLGQFNLTAEGCLILAFTIPIILIFGGGVYASYLHPESQITRSFLAAVAPIWPRVREFDTHEYYEEVEGRPNGYGYALRRQPSGFPFPRIEPKDTIYPSLPNPKPDIVSRIGFVQEMFGNMLMHSQKDTFKNLKECYANFVPGVEFMTCVNDLPGVGTLMQLTVPLVSHPGRVRKLLKGTALRSYLDLQESRQNFLAAAKDGGLDVTNEEMFKNSGILLLAAYEATPQTLATALVQLLSEPSNLSALKCELRSRFKSIESVVGEKLSEFTHPISHVQEKPLSLVPSSTASTVGSIVKEMPTISETGLTYVNSGMTPDISSRLSNRPCIGLVLHLLVPKEGSAMERRRKTRMMMYERLILRF
jgi:hypothetical protein